MNAWLNRGLASGCDPIRFWQPPRVVEKELETGRRQRQRRTTSLATGPTPHRCRTSRLETGVSNECNEVPGSTLWSSRRQKNTRKNVNNVNVKDVNND